MAANKIIRFGPVALTTTLTTNIVSPFITSLAGPVGFQITQPYVIIRHVRIVNKTGSSATCSFWLGAAAGNVAGTEVIAQGTSVPANQFLDWVGLLRLDGSIPEVLVGGAGTGSALTFEAEGEIGFS